MKKCFHLLCLSLLLLFSSLNLKASTPSPASFLGLSIAFSTHAYWAGPDLGCQPRERGWCLHISIDSKAPPTNGVICGEITNLATTGLMLSFNKRTGITPETFAAFFRDGKFKLEGEGTMSEEIAKKLGLGPVYAVPEGIYSYKEEGDVVTIMFRK